MNKKLLASPILALLVTLIIFAAPVSAEDLQANVTDDAQPASITAEPLQASFTAVALQANFTADPTSGNSPLVVLFTDHSVGSPSVYMWDFGDGGTSRNQNPSHTYLKPGDYTVTLTITRGPYSSTTSQIISIPGTDPATEKPIAHFTTVKKTGVAPFTVNFIDRSSGGPTAWLWSFGDLTTQSREQNPTHTYTKPGVYTVSLQVWNSLGACSERYVDYITVTAANLPPAANAGSDVSVNEGDPVAFSGSFNDPDTSDTHTIEWDFGDSSTASGTLTPSHTYADNGVYTVTLKVTDNNGGVGTDTLTVTVKNANPDVIEINPPVDPTILGTPITVDSAFTDAGILDTHTAVWDWGDGTVLDGSVTESNGAGTVSGTHTYSSAGIYQIKLTVTDKDLGSGSLVSTKYIVIYDPNGGFVTGGGWINSPAGAYVSNPSLTGTANFGFVSKYQKGAKVPTGATEFNFKVADLNFHSDSYDWLVVAGAKAQYKGTGTINGKGNYGFILTAVDGEHNGGGGTDKFRIKIWDKDSSDKVVYDNMVGVSDNADPTTIVQKGSITIHSD